MDKTIFVLAACFITFVVPPMVWCHQSQDVATNEQTRFVHEFPAMGVKFRVVAYAKPKPDSDKIINLLKQEIEHRVEYLESVFSDYRGDSEVSRIAASAPHHQPVAVSDELFEICQRSQHFFDLTDGAFDPSIGTVSKIWRFARKRNRLPDNSKVAIAMKSVGWKHVQLPSDNYIALKQSGIQFDFGGIAKGFAADQIIALLEKHSITSALVDAGGDIRVSASPTNASGWKIVTDQTDSNQLKLRLSNVGVATSGATRQRLSDRGTSYSHIIDPTTGKPVTHHWNVTVVAQDATSADALASAFSVLGKDASLKIADSSDDVFAIFVDVQSREVVYSNGFKKFVEK